MKHSRHPIGSLAVSRARDSLRHGHNKNVLGHSSGRVTKSCPLPARLAVPSQPSGSVRKWL